MESLRSTVCSSFSIVMILLLQQHTIFAPATPTIVTTATPTTLPLVSSVCSKTSQPPYCYHCLQTFSNGKVEDVRKITGLILSCVMAECLSIRSMLSNYNSSTHLKEYRQCGIIYEAVTNALYSANDSYDQKNWDNVDAYLEAADSTHLFCYNLLLKAKIFIPNDLATKFYWFRMYDRVARDVIHQLE